MKFAERGVSSSKQWTGSSLICRTNKLCAIFTEKRCVMLSVFAMWFDKMNDLLLAVLCSILWSFHE